MQLSDQDKSRRIDLYHDDLMFTINQNLLDANGLLDQTEFWRPESADCPVCNGFPWRNGKMCSYCAVSDLAKFVPKNTSFVDRSVKLINPLPMQMQHLYFINEYGTKCKVTNGGVNKQLVKTDPAFASRLIDHYPIKYTLDINFMAKYANEIAGSTGVPLNFIKSIIAKLSD